MPWGYFTTADCLCAYHSLPQHDNQVKQRSRIDGGGCTFHTLGNTFLQRTLYTKSRGRPKKERQSGMVKVDRSTVGEDGGCDEDIDGEAPRIPRNKSGRLDWELVYLGVPSP